MPVRARQALRCLVVLLLSAFAPGGGVLATTRQRFAAAGDAGSAGAESTPYLPAFGAMPLRFQEAAPPPDLSTRPAASAPPVPAKSPAESSVALANVAAAQPAAPASMAPTPSPVPSEPAPAAPSAPVPAKTPPPILPDDGRPTIRPEDFLPFFQIPGSAKNASDVMLTVPAVRSAPAPAPLPPSSATYTQSR